MDDILDDEEASEKTARQIGIDVEESGDAPCPEEGCDSTLEPADDCAMCNTCFGSACS